MFATFFSSPTNATHFENLEDIMQHIDRISIAVFISVSEAGQTLHLIKKALLLSEIKNNELYVDKCISVLMKLTEKINGYKQSSFKALIYTDENYNVDELFATAKIVSHEAGALKIALTNQKNRMALPYIPYQLEDKMNSSTNLPKNIKCHA